MKQILIAGFGGQGVLFAGKFLAYAGLLSGREVTWLPSYGPESRGGTSTCHVILSERPIGSPMVLTPDILICMNAPSLDKFEGTLAPGGVLFVDSSLVTRKAAADDAHYVPATQLAIDRQLTGLANIIMIGAVIGTCRICDKDGAVAAMKKNVSETKRNMFEANIRALEIGLSCGA